MAIQQHPLPQDISSYRFRLIGDMTIKQFASLGISIVLAIVIYSLPLPFFFKYPLSFLFIVLGVGMAFVPVQGRSLDVWILAFIRSIYSPTQYIWRHSKVVDEDMALPTGPNIGTQAVSNARIELSTGVTDTSPSVIPTDLPADTKAQLLQAGAEAAGTRVEESHSTTPITSPPVVQITPVIITPNAPLPESVTPTPTASVTPVISTVVEKSPSITPAPQPKADQPVVEITSNPEPTTSQVAQLPIPFTPTTPNTLVGLTLTPEGKILDGVLVEIQHNGLTSRATKSNKLGQFMFARPLENGLYQILAEKEDFTFSPYSLDLSGAIIRPLKIQAI